MACTPCIIEGILVLVRMHIAAIAANNIVASDMPLLLLLPLVLLLLLLRAMLVVLLRVRVVLSTAAP